jgi:nucleoside-diphosphate-sugar epimerase
MSIKNIIVFGAHGKVGQNFVRLAAKAGLQQTAVLRNEQQSATVGKLGAGIASKQLTLDAALVDEISQAIRGHDAVVVTVGSAGKNLLQVDLDGTVKVFEALVKANVRRLVLISAAFAGDREWFLGTALRDYYIAKHYADRILAAEFGGKLDYTVLRPGLLTDGAPTGKLSAAQPRDAGVKVDRADVAHAILAVLGQPQTHGKTYEFGNGDTPVEQYFK